MAFVHQLIIKPPFCDLFPIDPNLVSIIAEDMRQNQFDDSFPVVVWKEKGILIDGHTRVKAAELSGRQVVPHINKSFQDEDAAIRYAIHNQRNRRNMTEADLLRCIEAVDKRREQKEVIENQGRDESGKFQPSASNDAHGKSSKKTAEIVGTSQAKVERARRVISDPKEKEAVLSGKKSINKASEDAKTKKNQKPIRDEQGKFAKSESRQETLAKALSELRAWRKKYKKFHELAEIFNVIDSCS